MNNIYQFLQPVDFIIVTVYMLILLGIGYWVSFVQKKKTEENLFLAQRSLGWASIGLNMWGTNVGPSMLIASASIGYTTGIVAGNFAWYAFIFILLLAVVFAPRYLGSRVSTLPEYMGRHFGESTRNILAWYTLITILISWLSLGQFAGGILVRQLLGLPMWLSVISMVVLATFFTAAGGLKAIAYTNVFQMLLLIAVSGCLVWMGLSKVGGIGALYEKTPPTYWNLFLPGNDKKYPWQAILLETAADVLSIDVDPIALAGQFVGVVGAQRPGADTQFEVRAFFRTANGMGEDPVTGSLNAALGQWLIDAGHAPEHYRVAQGTRLGRAGRVDVDRIDGTVWVGGLCTTVLRGTAVV